MAAAPGGISIETVGLWIGIVAAVLGAIFSLPPFLEWIRRPRLILRRRGDTMITGHGEGWQAVEFQMELHNAGRGYARAWRVKIRTPDLMRRIGLPNEYGRREPPTAAPSWNQHQMADGRWIVEWWAASQGEAVPPKQDHPLPTPCEARIPPGGKLTGDFQLLAEGARPREGTIEVSLVDDGAAIRLEDR